MKPIPIKKSKGSIAMTSLVVIAVLIIALLLFAASKPDTFSVERSITIQATPEKIFPLINNFHAWQTWSPWERMDPDIQRSHSGAAEGKASVYAWEGNNKVGKGQMEIVESSPPSRILIQLDFISPFKAHNSAEFTLTPHNNKTRVQWVMRGPNNFVAKIMQVFVSMDSMVGKDFESGLNHLKAIAEHQADVLASETTHE